MPTDGSDRILARLLALHPKLIDLSLERVHRLLARLDHPERALPPVVHVAGTNGKGSVVAFLRAIAEAAGLRVHVYTSPHLVRFHERIRVAGRVIAEGRLAALLAECERANQGAPITFFEITTAAAFLAFARTAADLTLLEVGLGGRLDATNVVAAPRATVITPVDLDHTQHLGSTVAAIAGEKAGILKPGCPAVIGPQLPAAAAVIAAQATAVGAPLWRAGLEWTAQATEGGGVAYRDAAGALELPRPALAGLHQVMNAATAVACARRLGGFGTQALLRGLQRAEWPARLQRLWSGPLVERLPRGWELWLDGGHNPHAGRALATQFERWRDRPLHLVVGMINTKTIADFMAALAAPGVVASLQGVAIPGQDATLSAAAIVAAAKAAGLSALAAAGVDAALDQLCASEVPGRVLICGSLYLAGTVLAENG